MISFEPV
jgi:hypothetical protein